MEVIYPGLILEMRNLREMISGPRKWVKDFWGPELSLLTNSSPFLYPFLGWPCLHSDSQPSGGDAEGAHHEDIHHVIPGKISNRDSAVSGAGPEAWRWEDFCVVLLEILPSSAQYFILKIFFFNHTFLDLAKRSPLWCLSPGEKHWHFVFR